MFYTSIFYVRKQIAFSNTAVTFGVLSAGVSAGVSAGISAGVSAGVSVIDSDIVTGSSCITDFCLRDYV